MLTSIDGSRMLELAPAIGVGGSDLQQAVRAVQIGRSIGAGKTSARDAYFESRDMYNKLRADGKASPAALVLASSAVGSYSITEDPDGSGVAIFLANNGSWGSRGAAIGEAIGLAIGGATGALIGGEVGGAIGAAVDKCTN